MNKRQRITLMTLAAILAFGAGCYAAYQAGVRHGMPAAPASPATADAGAGAGGKKPLYWHDPMYPAQKFDRPGKSPFMDMQLVPVYGDDASGGAAVSISPGVQQNLGVRLGEVTEGVMASDLVASGNVAYNERDVVLVQARSAGFIERQYVRAPLDPVRKGQPLLELYVPDWVAAQEEFLSARRLQGGGTAGIVDAARQRMRLAGMPEDLIRQVEGSGAVRARATLTAPAGGVVSELAAREGMTVAPGATLFRINGTGTVWVLADIPETAVAQVQPGLAVEAGTPALPGVVFKGKVNALLPRVDGATRTLQARIELANPSAQLVPGMFATVKFARAAGGRVLQVPAEAVIRTGTRNAVMLAQPGGKFLPAEVETGAEAGGMVEIRKGLQRGQQVVVSGQFLIDSEASLKGTANRMAGEAGEAGAAASAAPGPRHHAEGRVERIADGKVTISHGPVASLQWGPMTMDFDAPPGGLPRNVATGDAVSFDFRQRADGGFALIAIAPTSAAPASVSPASKSPEAPK
ncbi:efflux RND transporter periplasmic adaptor subunit [Pseudoduganella sp. LjRoot289]|uniref:efflux RND transporter periplasmic adaptor subunit n=1 Tax=Pseudoduganella sp. LjRoot289 TaxID=3342314 RepID=UPI003ECFAE17